jgi:hypothetical protein
MYRLPVLAVRMNRLPPSLLEDRRKIPYQVVLTEVPLCLPSPPPQHTVAALVQAAAQHALRITHADACSSFPTGRQADCKRQR